MKSQTRHEQLIAAGWIYDADSDRYRAPGSATDGTATLFNLRAAWDAYLASIVDSANQPIVPPKTQVAPDPRKQEPQ